MVPWERSVAAIRDCQCSRVISQRYGFFDSLGYVRELRPLRLEHPRIFPVGTRHRHFFGRSTLRPGQLGG